MDEYCNPVDKAAYGASIREILDVFRRILAGELDNDISMLNYYKGIPINYPATILGIDNEFVEFETHAYQTIAIGHDKSTFIKSSHFRQEILAETFYVKIPSREVSLKNFLFTKVLAENRNYVRVALQQARTIEVDYAHQQLKGNLVDVCLKSAAVDLPPGFVLRPGTFSRIHMMLPMGTGNPDLSIDVPARASKATAGRNATRCIFDLQGDLPDEARIARFIGHRQTEIVNEIREAFWAQEAKERNRTAERAEGS